MQHKNKKETKADEGNVTPNKFKGTVNKAINERNNEIIKCE